MIPPAAGGIAGIIGGIATTGIIGAIAIIGTIVTGVEVKAYTRELEVQERGISRNQGTAKTPICKKIDLNLFERGIPLIVKSKNGSTRILAQDIMKGYRSIYWESLRGKTAKG